MFGGMVKLVTELADVRDPERPYENPARVQLTRAEEWERLSRAVRVGNRLKHVARVRTCERENRIPVRDVGAFDTVVVRPRTPRKSDRPRAWSP